ncbi:hypothetical protein NMY22_g16030 [Coprinellus aureogranulatus]|nr:hypothetical protein NMY22_g16030 [Coprinellus aureogranulatus]
MARGHRRVTHSSGPLNVRESYINSTVPTSLSTTPRTPLFTAYIIMSTFDLVAQTSPGQLGVVQAPIPEPTNDQVLIKVEYSTLGPSDLGIFEREHFIKKYPFVFGLSAAGTVVKVGRGLGIWKLGSRVAAITFPPGMTGLQPYTVQHRNNVAKIPDSLPFEQAVSYPDNLVTAFYALFNQLGLPEPTEWPVSSKNNPDSERPILVYGAGATSGQYALQLFKLAGYTKVVAAASKRHEEYLKSLGASHVVDYNSPSFAKDVVSAAEGKVELVMDCISLPSTFALIKQVIKPGGKLAFLAPFKAGSTKMIGAEGEPVYEAPDEVKEGFPEAQHLPFLTHS